eukprot:scaffold3375_cov153-Cylindrotheca_fusiformis.AAC.6
MAFVDVIEGRNVGLLFGNKRVFHTQNCADGSRTVALRFANPEIDDFFDTAHWGQKHVCLFPLICFRNEASDVVLVTCHLPLQSIVIAPTAARLEEKIIKTRAETVPVSTEESASCNLIQQFAEYFLALIRSCK